MTKTNTNLFEKYLQEVHAKECPEVLGGDSPEHYDNWLKRHDLVYLANQALAAMQEKYEKETCKPGKVRYRNEQEGDK